MIWWFKKDVLFLDCDNENKKKFIKFCYIEGVMYNKLLYISLFVFKINLEIKYVNKLLSIVWL